MMSGSIGRGTFAAAAGAMAMLLFAGPASSTATISITAPAPGTAVSWSQTPVFLASGSVVLDQPAPATLRLFLGVSGVCAARVLTPTDSDTSFQCGGGTGGAQQGIVNELLITGDMSPATRSYDAVAGALPLTLGQGEANGVLRLRGEVNLGTPTLVLKLEGRVDGSQEWVSLGTGTTTESVDPTGSYHDFEFSFPIAQAYDQEDLREVRLTWYVRGTGVLYGYTYHDGSSYIDLPVYDASFDQSRLQVEVALDGGAFSSNSVELSADRRSWTAVMNTPPQYGEHTVHARSIQGSAFFAATASRTFEVVP